MDSVIIVHGFMGESSNVKPLANHLQSKYEVDVPLLPGHGNERERMGKVKRFDWIDSVESSLKEHLVKRRGVHLIGHSMGALIVAYLAAKYAGRIKSVSMLSTPLFIGDIRNILEPFRKGYIPFYLKQALNTPIVATMEFRKLKKELFPYMSQVDCPLLIMHGRKDNVAHAKSSILAYEMARTEKKELLIFEKSNHEMILGEEFQEISDAVLNFLSSNTETRQMQMLK